MRASKTGVFVEVEPEPPANDLDAVASGLGDVVDGDEDAAGDEVDDDDDGVEAMGAQHCDSSAAVYM